MLEIFRSEAFWFGGIILLVYQWAKFSELSTSAVLSNRAGSIPNLRANDFAGPLQFRGALFVFLAATVAIYLLACSISPSVIRGWLVLSGAEGGHDELIANYPYPLYIAALYMGLTQPAIPGLSRIGNLQKDVFHYWIGIPNRVIGIGDYLLNQIFARCQTKEQLVSTIERMVSDTWIAEIDPYADVVFYRRELERLRLSDKEDLVEASAGSLRELRTILSQLMYAAALATVRESGGGALKKLASDLGTLMPGRNDNRFRAIFFGVVMSAFALVVLVFALPLLAEVFEAFGRQPSIYWPDNPRSAGQFLIAQMLPVLCATGLLLLVGLRPGDPRETHRFGRFTSLIERNAPSLLAVFVFVIFFDYLQLLSDFSASNPIESANVFEFLLSWAPYHMLHAMVIISGCLVLLHHFWLIADNNRRHSKFWMLASTMLVLAFASAFYSLSRLAFQFDDLSLANIDYIALIVFLNAFAGALSALAVLAAVPALSKSLQ